MKGAGRKAVRRKNIGVGSKGTRRKKGRKQGGRKNRRKCEKLQKNKKINKHKIIEAAGK